VKKYLPLLLGIIAGMAFLAVCIFFMGGGHGTYIPSKIFFPYTMLSTVETESISPFFIVLAFIQYPLYGLIIQFGKEKKKKILRSSIIGIVHVIAMILALTFENAHFN
jgi:hypothetical protein